MPAKPKISMRASILSASPAGALEAPTKRTGTARIARRSIRRAELIALTHTMVSATDPPDVVGEYSRHVVALRLYSFAFPLLRPIGRLNSQRAASRSRTVDDHRI